MRRILQATMVAALLAGTVAPGAVRADGPLTPLVFLNNSAVTQYELDQRVRFMTLLRAPGAEREAALKALIDDRLKLDAARSIGITVSDKGLEEGLAEFAGRADMDVDQFTRQLAENGVERQAYRDFVKSGVAWREVVRQRILPTVRVSDAEIDQAMRKEIETPIVTQVLLSEMVMPAPQGSEGAVAARGAELAATITTEAQFAAAARQYSATPSAQRGGRLDWTPLDNLPPSLVQIILSMQPGQVSQPLTVPGAVVLFYLRDTRGRLRAGAGEQTVDYVTLALPDAATGAQILARADSCEQVFVEANRFAGDPIARQTQALGAVPGDIAQRLASLDPNEGAVIDYGAGARLVMLCGRQPSLIADEALAQPLVPGAVRPSPPPGAAEAPNAQNAAEDAAIAAGVARPAEPPLTSRAAMREALFNRKINAAADAYLAELRAGAIIRRP
ncbi:peptidylprolyl isomerase [Paracoccus luteus]|uniref:peptidylprolyl isomerase n=1 Tax=Paracoccus luteus TaxID=2508543 RepID=UPI00106FD211|nr:peptidylprolyl isomerase [Paracoccus luteus]